MKNNLIKIKKFPFSNNIPFHNFKFLLMIGLLKTYKKNVN